MPREIQHIYPKPLFCFLTYPEGFWANGTSDWYTSHELCRVHVNVSLKKASVLAVLWASASQGPVRILHKKSYSNDVCIFFGPVCKIAAIVGSFDKCWHMNFRTSWSRYTSESLIFIPPVVVLLAQHEGCSGFGACETNFSCFPKGPHTISFRNSKPPKNIADMVFEP